MNTKSVIITAVALASVLLVAIACAFAGPIEPRVAVAARVPAPMKAIYYPMSYDPKHWTGLPAGCLPYVVDGGGRYFDADGKFDSWWIGGYYGVGATAENGWKPTGEVWQHFDAEKLKAGLRDYPPGTLYVLDWEHLPLDVRYAADADVEQSIRKLRAFFAAARSARPDMRFGLYGMMPNGDYWHPTWYFTDVDAGLKASAQDAKGWADLQAANNRFTFGLLDNGKRNASGGLIDAVDVLCPSGYDFYAGNDQGPYIRASVAECRRIGGKRQVAMFAWTQYHPSNADVGGQRIPIPEWRETMRLMFSTADSVVLWEPMGGTPPTEYLQVVLEERERASR